MSDRYSYHFQGVDGNGYPLNMRPKYRHKGYFWYVSKLLAYIMRPNSCFEKLIMEKKIAAGWGRLTRPALSLHVRQGDSCIDTTTHRVCEPLDSYMQRAVIPMAEK